MNGTIQAIQSMPEIHRMFIPRRINCPLDYCAAEDIGALFWLAALSSQQHHYLTGKEPDNTKIIAYRQACMMTRLGMPLYHVGADFLRAIHATRPPNMLFSELRWPMQVMAMALHVPTSKDLFGVPIHYLVASHTDPGVEPLKDQKFPFPFEIQTTEPRVDFTAWTITGDDEFQCFGGNYPGTDSIHNSFDSTWPFRRDGGCITNDDGKPVFLPVNYDDDDEQRCNDLARVAFSLVLASTQIESVAAELATTGDLSRPARVRRGVLTKDAIFNPKWIGKNYRIRRERSAGTGTHASPTFHWREGHWRNQPFGPKRAQMKRIWIEPTEVGAPK